MIGLSNIGLPRIGSKDGPMIGICVGHAMTHWYPGAFVMILPFFKDDLGLSWTEVGFLIGLRGITSALVNLPGGMLVDVFGRRKLIMAMAIAWAGIPYFFLGLTSNFLIIAAALAIVGVGNLLYHPAALSSLSELYPTRRGFATAMHSLGASFGDTVSPLVVGFVLTWYTWREVTLLNAIPGIIMSIIFWRMMKGVRLQGPKSGVTIDLRNYARGFSTLIRDGNMLWIALLGGARATTQTALHTFLPTYLTTVAMLTTPVAGAYMAIVQGAGLISGPVAGGLSDRIGRRPLIAGGMLTTSALLAVAMMLNVELQVAWVEWLFILVLALIGFFLFSLTPVLNAWALDVAPPELGGTSIGILFATQSILGAVTPPVGGWIADTWGLQTTFYFIAATVLVANLMIFAIKDDGRRALKKT